MRVYSRVCARIDLDAICQNISNMKANLPEQTKMAAVIKADGYGHGAAQIARVLEEREYIWGFAVATSDEAVVLRKAGIKKPLFILGCVFPDQYQDIFTYDLDITIYTLEAAKAVSKLARERQQTVSVHIKLDTGMGRIGFLVNEESVLQIEEISKLPNLEMTGLFTHFAKADETDKTFTTGQIEKYQWIKEQLESKGIGFKYYHCSNSAGIIDVKEAHMNLVRAGISTYGLYPSEEVSKETVRLTPALSLISHAANVKWVEPGTSISYGGIFITARRTRVVTVPVGYGDGYPRSLSNKGYVLIHGQEAPIIGRVCMDQFMVDATEIEDVKFGDKITLVGFDGKEHLPVEKLSRLSGRFNYEFVCDLGKRIPREYLKNGDVIAQMDFFA
ncbi:MAG: alanine racemase [Lachnospiraceae bacterium]